MKKRRISPVVVAVGLTVGGMAAFGGIQLANATVTTSPSLSCLTQADPNPAVTGAEGSTWDNGSGPGSAGIFTGANPGSVTKLSAVADSGATSVEIDALGVYGQTFTISGAIGTYTDVDASDWVSTAPETIDITPSLSLVSGTSLRLNTSVTLNPTTTTPNRSVDDGITSGTDLQSATAAFTSADVGQPVTGATGGGLSGAAVVPFGTTISQVNSSTDVTLSQSATSNTSGVDLTIGYTNEASTSVSTDYDYQSTGCEGTLTGSGVYSPTTATMIGHDAGIDNGVLVLDQNPSNLSLAVTYPSVGSGWVDNGGTGSATQPTTTENFTVASKEKYVEIKGLYTNAPSWDYTGGSATGDFPITAGVLDLEDNGGIACTAAQLQATDSGTGPDASTIPEGGSELAYCDGGTDNQASASNALLLLLAQYAITPSQAQVFGSDGTPYVAAWSMDGQSLVNSVF